MNISPIAISKNFAVRNQIANKSYQTNFKGLGADTVSFSGKEPLTAENFQARYELAMIYSATHSPEDAIKFSNYNQFVEFLKDLKINEKDDEQLRALKQGARDEIIGKAFEVGAGEIRIRNIREKYDWEAKEGSVALKALADLANPEERRDLLLNEKAIKSVHSLNALKCLVQIFRGDKEAEQKIREIDIFKLD